MPSVNGLLFVAVVAFVVGFKNSDALSAAYGSAVIGTMTMTTVLGSYVADDAMELAEAVRCAALRTAVADGFTSFIAGNLTKVHDGGWIPLAMAAVLFFRVLDLARWACGAEGRSRRRWRCRSPKVEHAARGRAEGAGDGRVSRAAIRTSCRRP